MDQAAFGFFHWLTTNSFAPSLLGECKNYKNDVANAEVDQLLGRFSPARSCVGLLLYRSIKNRDLLIIALAEMPRDGGWNTPQADFLHERTREIAHTWPTVRTVSNQGALRPVHRPLAVTNFA